MATTSNNLKRLVLLLSKTLRAFCAKTALRALCITFPALNALAEQSSNQLDELTLEAKVGQLLVVHFHGEVAGEDARFLIQEIKAGGVIYYNWSNSLHSPSQIQTLSHQLQLLARQNQPGIPLFIAIDQEDGLVSRLSNGFAQFPGNKALGKAKEADLAENAALIMGREMKAVGINMNLAPVVDVHSNPKNPIIGIRAYAKNPEKVARFGLSALLGYRQAGIISTLKHYPGHGDAEVDSHNGLPVINKSLEELQRCELIPFARLAKKADAIMTAHLMIPAFDSTYCSTLSEKSLKYLRQELGFEGVIISDSLMMDGLLQNCPSIEEAAVLAFNAGCDLLLLGGKQIKGSCSHLELRPLDVARIHHALTEAVKSGRIDLDRLNQSVQRILELKKRSISTAAFLPPPKLEGLCCEGSATIAAKIAKQAIRCTKRADLSFLKSYDVQKIGFFVPKSLEQAARQLRHATVFYDPLEPTETQLAARCLSEKSDVLVVFSFNAWKHPGEIAALQALNTENKTVILIVMADPIDSHFLPEAHMTIYTFSPSLASFNCACKLLYTLFND